MKPEDKELILKDLSARLPYGVVCAGITYTLDDDGERYVPIKVKNTLTEIYNYKLETAGVELGLLSFCKLETVKPYLRPMDSMTEEERIESLEFAWIDDYGRLASYNENIPKYIDWLNKKMFDYRGLIPMGLAIAVTRENNPYEN